MRFSINKLYWLVFIFSYVATKTEVEYIFNVMPLGHSGLLIYWKPNITTETEESAKLYNFLFKKRIVGEKSYDSANGVSEYYNSSEGQYKIHSLAENTFYEVIVEQHDSEMATDTPLLTYSMKMRTNLKSNEKPVKPYFDFYNNLHFFRIRWCPCGKERICNNHESGTHFGISIKDLYSTRKNEEIREEFYKDSVIIHLWPGRMYEVNVYSINGESKTNSDSQEIYMEPHFTMVQYVNIISLPNSSVLISWKPPKHSMDDSLVEYIVIYLNLKKPNTDHVIFHKDIENNKLANFGLTSYEQIRLRRMPSSVLNTYFIVPRGNVGVGFEYTFQYKLRVYDDDLEIARPDFNYKLIPENGKCRFDFQWLPCGQSFDCKNTKPGSNYHFEFKPKPVKKTNVEESGYYTGIFDINLKYYVTLNSSIGSNFSEPVTKIFKGCNEIQENILLGEEGEN